MVVTLLKYFTSRALFKLRLRASKVPVTAAAATVSSLLLALINAGYLAFRKVSMLGSLTETNCAEAFILTRRMNATNSSLNDNIYGARSMVWLANYGEGAFF